MTVERPDSRSSAAGHIAALDGLRGLAIIMVLFVHFIGDATPNTGLERAMVKLGNYGVWGVDLFFVLSGFLITGILHDSKTSAHYFRNFYVRRTLRIFPLYYGVLALLFVVLPALPAPYPAGLAESARHQAWLWPYATNVYLAIRGTWALPYVSHFWSLAVEEHFYLVWPLVVLSFARPGLLRICAITALLSFGLRCVWSLRGASDVALVVLTPCRLDALCVGAFLAIAARSVGLARMGRTAKPAFIVLVFLILVASMCSATLASSRQIAGPIRGTLMALAFGALLVMSLVAERTSLLSRLLTSRLLRLFGKYSYGLYVFHGIVAFALYERPAILDALAERLGSHTVAIIAQAVLGGCVSLLIAVASYEFFEKHFLRLKDSLAPSGADAVAAAISHPPRLG